MTRRRLDLKTLSERTSRFLKLLRSSTHTKIATCCTFRRAAERSAGRYYGNIAILIGMVVRPCVSPIYKRLADRRENSTTSEFYVCSCFMPHHFCDQFHHVIFILLFLVPTTYNKQQRLPDTWYLVQPVFNLLSPSYSYIETPKSNQNGAV